MLPACVSPLPGLAGKVPDRPRRRNEGTQILQLLERGHTWLRCRHMCRVNTRGQVLRCGVRHSVKCCAALHARMLRALSADLLPTTGMWSARSLRSRLTPFPDGSEHALFPRTSGQPRQVSHERVLRLHLSCFFLSASTVRPSVRLGTPSRSRNLSG